jgi:AcrR family transcriptional regulator
MAATTTAMPRPKGPDAVADALFAATERLCNEQPPGTVTVRDIADAANVNHGLVHHYFESKQALLGATMIRVEQEFLHQVERADNPAEAIGRFFDALNDRPTYPRLLSWMLLQGADPTQQINDFPLVDHLVEVIRAETDQRTARLRTQALLAFVAGWATTHEFIAGAAGLTEGELARSHDWGRDQAIGIALGRPDPNRDDRS